jgi:hypothetical protein
MVKQKQWLLFISFLMLSVFSSEEEKIKGSVSSINTILNISNSILKCYVTKYITIMDVFNLFRTNQGFYSLYGGENFTRWLQNNEHVLKLFYKPSIYKEIICPKIDFILKCPPGTLKSDVSEPFTFIFEFNIMGPINPYGTSYLKRKSPKSKSKEEGDFKIKRRTNCLCPAIRIFMDEEENFHYQFRHDALTKINVKGSLTSDFKVPGGHFKIKSILGHIISL